MSSRSRSRSRCGGGSVDPFSLFQYEVNFADGTTKGCTQPYGNNNNDGRAFSDESNINAVILPNGFSGNDAVAVVAGSAGLRRGLGGIYVYPARNHICLQNRNLVNPSWTKTNMSTFRDQLGPLNTANSASRMVATANGATCTQAITDASTARYLSAYIKRLVGSGTLEMTMDGGTTWVDVTSQFAAGRRRVSIPTQTLANPTVGFRIGTNGDSFEVDYVTLEDGTYPSHPFGISTVAVAVSQSRPSAQSTKNSPLFTPMTGAFAFYWEGSADRPSGCSVFVSDNNTLADQKSASGDFEFLSANNNGVTTATGAWVTGLANINKVAGYVASDGSMKLCVNGVLASRASGATLAAAATHWDLSQNGNGGAVLGGIVRRFCMSPNLIFSDAQLTAMTT